MEIESPLYNFIHFLRQADKRKLKQLENNFKVLEISWVSFKNRYRSNSSNHSYQSSTMINDSSSRRFVLRRPLNCYCSLEDCNCDSVFSKIPSGDGFVRTKSIEDLKAKYLSHLDKDIIPLTRFTERRSLYEEIKLKIPTISIATQTSCVDSRESRTLKFVQELPPDRVLQVKAFRETNIDQCMSDLNKNIFQSRNLRNRNKIEAHSCVHRFRLNERNHLVPIKVNKSGQSICEQCGAISEYLEKNKNGVLGRKEDEFRISGEILEIPTIILEVGSDPKNKTKKKSSRKISSNTAKKFPENCELVSSSFALRFQKKA